MRGSRVTFLLLVLALAGCAARRTVTVPTDAPVEASLGFLEEGTTTRDEIVSILGSPCGSFEGGKILSYRLDDKLRVVSHQLIPDVPAPPWKGASHSLVLLLDERGVLVRRSLVRVR